MSNKEEPDTHRQPAKRKRRQQSDETKEHEFFVKHTGSTDEEDPLVLGWEHMQESRGWE